MVKSDYDITYYVGNSKKNIRFYTKEGKNSFVKSLKQKRIPHSIKEIKY